MSRGEGLVRFPLMGKRIPINGKKNSHQGEIRLFAVSQADSYEMKSALVLGLLVVHVDVDADAGDDHEDGNELYKVVVNETREVAQDEQERANDGDEDSGIEFHVVFMFFVRYLCVQKILPRGKTAQNKVKNLNCRNVFGKKCLLNL